MSEKPDLSGWWEALKAKIERRRRMEYDLEQALSNQRLPPGWR